MARFDAWRDRDVLEAGCGIGTDGVRFARAGARYTGIDFSATALALARRRFGEQRVGGTLLEGSITELPFGDGSFDLVYSNGVIHHVPDAARAVAELRRVLRPGGEVVAMVYHRRSLNYRATILGVRRLLAAVLLVPGGVALARRLTGEAGDVLDGHRRL